MLLRADHPDNHVVGPIRRGGKRRATPVPSPIHAPCTGNSGWISCSNAESRKCVGASAENDVGALLGSIGCRCLDDAGHGNLRRGYRRADPAEVVPVNQICVGILAQRNHEVGWCCAGHVHQQWTGAAQIRVLIVERKPVCGHPIIGGRAAEDWAGLETNHRFAATPVAIDVKGVPGGSEWVLPITGDAAEAPYSAAPYTSAGGRGPCCYAGGIIYRHAYQPAMIEAAIHHTPISNIKNAAHDAERRSLLLGRCREGDPVV